MSKTTVASTGIDLSDTFAFTGTVTGTNGKLVDTSRVLYTSGTVTLNTSSMTDTGIDHTYTGASTSNKLLHIINCGWRKQTEGGQAGGVSIYAADSAITEINSSIALGEWHQDSATADMKGSSIHYFSANIASTNAIKYSIYAKGEDFRLQNGSGYPLIWTIMEIA